MKNKILIIFASLVLLISMIDLSSALVEPTQDYFSSNIIGLQPNPNITFDKIISLCTQESCVIDEEMKTITIRSHYDNRVALIFHKECFDQCSSDNPVMELVIYIKVPYKLEKCPDKDLMCAVSDTIDPKTYNWKESVKTDLSFLKQVGVLSIQDNDINEISSMAKDYQSITNIVRDPQWTMKFRDKWRSVTYGCGAILDANSSLSYHESCPSYTSTGATSEFPILPSKEFGLVQNSSLNPIYWIIGIIIVVAIAIFFLVKRKK